MLSMKFAPVLRRRREGLIVSAHRCDRFRMRYFLALHFAKHRPSHLSKSSNVYRPFNSFQLISGSSSQFYVVMTFHVHTSSFFIYLRTYFCFRLNKQSVSTLIARDGVQKVLKGKVIRDSLSVRYNMVHSVKVIDSDDGDGWWVGM